MINVNKLCKALWSYISSLGKQEYDLACFCLICCLFLYSLYLRMIFFTFLNGWKKIKGRIVQETWKQYEIPISMCINTNLLEHHAHLFRYYLGLLSYYNSRVTTETIQTAKAKICIICLFKLLWPCPESWSFYSVTLPFIVFCYPYNIHIWWSEERR